MSFINICRDNTDPFYRYKMPQFNQKLKVEVMVLKLLLSI